MGCNCGGGGRPTGAQPSNRPRRQVEATEPRERREGGPQDKGSSYYSGPRRAKKTT